MSRVVLGALACGVGALLASGVTDDHDDGRSSTPRQERFGSDRHRRDPASRPETASDVGTRRSGRQRGRLAATTRSSSEAPPPARSKTSFRRRASSVRAATRFWRWFSRYEDGTVTRRLRAGLRRTASPELAHELLRAPPDPLRGPGYPAAGALVRLKPVGNRTIYGFVRRGRRLTPITFELTSRRGRARVAAIR